MIVKLSNHSQKLFKGWWRVAIDFDPPHAAGEMPDGTRYVMGRSTGRDTRALDLLVKLQPGETKELDLSTSQDIDFEIQQPKGIDWTGGVLQVNQHEMDWVDLKRDGAAYVAHLRKRVSPMMHVDVWLRHYPDQPWAEGEMMVTCSNGSVPDVAGTMPKTRLLFGDAFVVTPGKQFYESAIDKTVFADGQARVIPFLTIWDRNIGTSEEGESVGAIIDQGISGVGIQTLLPDGNPLYVSDYSGRQWAKGLWGGAIERLHDWGPPVCGIAPQSTQTGAQEDQLFVRGEALLPDWVGADQVTYWSAIKYANRPCHHLEANGDRIRQDDHPSCVFWQSRAHGHRGVSPDQLGKSSALDPNQVPGLWWGADREHWLVGTLSAGARYTGSPALQALLEHQANAFLFGETTDARLSTSHFDSARSVGYAGIVAVQLWNNLTDRQLAAQVRERFRERVVKVYIPELSGKVAWDPRKDNRIIGDLDPKYTDGVMWWQQALGSYGLDLACIEFNIPEGRELALAGAKAVLKHAIRWQDERWVVWDNTAWTGSELDESDYVEGKGAHRTGWFDTAWLPCAVATVLRHEPEHTEALAIWAQMMAEAKAAGDMSWMAPGVGQ